MFRVGDYVVYGMNGVCRVEAIGPMSLVGVDQDKDYYTLEPVYTKGSRVFTPVDNQKVIIREVADREEILALIDEISEIDVIDGVDDKRRELAYKEAIRSCDCREWIRVVNTVKKRKEERLAMGKKMSACDERYLKIAQDHLFGEFAIGLEIEKDEVETFVEHRLLMKNMASAS